MDGIDVGGVDAGVVDVFGVTVGRVHVVVFM